MVGSICSAMPLPARPPTMAPTAAPTAVPTGPTTEPAAAPAAMPPAAAPRPVPIGCAPGVPLMGSRLGLPLFSLRSMNAPPIVFEAVRDARSCFVPSMRHSEHRDILWRQATTTETQMPTMYDVSVPTITRALQNFVHVLEK